MNDRNFDLTIKGNYNGAYKLIDADGIKEVLELILPMVKGKIAVKEK